MVHPFDLLHDDFLVLRDLVDVVVDHLAFDEDLLVEILGTDFVQMKLVELLGCIVDYFDLKLVGEVLEEVDIDAEATERAADSSE